MINNENNKIKVLVIGAGPAGMMAAGAAAESGADVVLVEKNQKVGRKLAITGKGRCNITNFCDNETFIAHVTANPRFLYSAINRFSCYDTVAFFEDRGLATKVERANRVFPVSDKALDVVDTLYDYLYELGVKIIHQEVSGLLVDNGVIKGVRIHGKELYADRVIITCGGMSYRATGSTGDGYTFAKAAGHTITPLLPSLVPLVAEDEDVPALQGLSLKNVRLSVTDNHHNKEVYSDMGEMLFTHHGISGPLVLSASSLYVKCGASSGIAVVDLKPALTPEQLDERLLKDLNAAGKKQLKNSLDALLPKKLIPVILSLSGIDPETRAIDITKAQRQTLVTLLKNLTMTVKGTGGFEEAVITQGGVDVKEVRPDTMESKLVKGLYFAGEVLDLDAVTGGFNLQIAWSTGAAAGRND